MPITLSEDEIDDLLYFARTGDSEEFHKLKDELFAREGLKGEGALAGLLTAAKDGESGNGVLHMAAANGYEGLLKELCKGLSQPTPQNPTMLSILNAQNKAGNTPLHWAALNGHLESVKVLLEEGSDPTITNQRGHDAVYEAELNDKKEIVEWVLKEGGEGLESGLGGDAGEGPSGGDGGENEVEEDIDVVDVGEDGKLEDGLKDLNISGDKS